MTVQEDDFWRNVDCASESVFASEHGGLARMRAQPAMKSDAYSAQTHLQAYLQLSSADALSSHSRKRKNASDGGDWRRAANAKKKRAIADSRNTLRAPPVPSADALTVKQYPNEHQKKIDAALRNKNVRFDVPASVHAFIARPATKDMGKYWYVLWHTVFALVEKDPERLLPRAAQHVALLYRAQSALESIVKQKRPSADIEAEKQSALCGAAPRAKCCASNDVESASGSVAALAQSNGATFAQAPTANFAALYCAAARRDVPHYTIDKHVQASLHYLIDTRSSGEFDRSKTDFLLALHETCWAFLFGIVERLGDMFLSRECLQPNALQLALAQRAYLRERARNAAHLILPQGARNGAKSKATSDKPRVLVSAVRDLLFCAFERLSA